MNKKASFVSVVHALSTLTDQEIIAIAEKPELLKQFASNLAAEISANTFVVHMHDKDVPDDYYETALKWRKIANNIGYGGPIAWKVKAGYTLKEHASQDKNSFNKLGHMFVWELANEKPTKDSLVFWIPRLVADSTNKTISQMEKIRKELQQYYKLPPHHGTSFGSIALLFALILAHFKRIGERVPLEGLYAVSDTLHADEDGRRLVAGDFGVHGLTCSDWGDKHRFGEVGFFLLGVEELG